MIHGRIIGNELRDVPRERLPVWGQRWFPSHNAQGPSEYETRTFQVTNRGMFQVGPALSSPSQFYMTISEHGQEDGGPSPSSMHHPVPSPSPSVQMYATELTPSSSSTSRVVHHPLVHRYHGDRRASMSQGQANTLRPTPLHRVPRGRNPAGPPLAMLPLEAAPEFSPSTHRHVAQVQHGFLQPEYDSTFWHTNSSSTSIQPRAGSSRESHAASAQPQEFLPSDVSHWQFAAGPSHSSTHSPQLDSSLHFEGSYHVHPDYPTGVFLTPTSSSSQSFTPPLPQQDSSSSWLPELNIPVIPPTLSFQNPTTARWPSGSGSVITEPLQAAGSSSEIDEEFMRLLSDPNRNPSSLEESFDTFAQSHVDGRIPPSNTTHGGGQSTRMIG